MRVLNYVFIRRVEVHEQIKRNDVFLPRIKNIYITIVGVG